ncbi:MAG: retroviral-like aspartic protease family protein [Armatimonadota bacterium]
MSLQVPYDTGYSPPAPVVTIALLSPIDPRLSLTANALLDTGADITVVPDWLPSRLRLIPVGDAFVVGIEGTSRHLIVYDLHLMIGQLSLQNVRVAAAPITEFILGRNVINSLDLRLNGPQLVLEILNA